MKFFLCPCHIINAPFIVVIKMEVEDVLKETVDKSKGSRGGKSMNHKIRFGLNLSSAACLDLGFVRVTSPS